MPKEKGKETKKEKVEENPNTIDKTGNIKVKEE